MIPRIPPIMPPWPGPFPIPPQQAKPAADEKPKRPPQVEKAGRMILQQAGLQPEPEPKPAQSHLSPEDFARFAQQHQAALLGALQAILLAPHAAAGAAVQPPVQAQAAPPQPQPARPQQPQVYPPPSQWPQIQQQVSRQLAMLGAAPPQAQAPQPQPQPQLQPQVLHGLVPPQHMTPTYPAWIGPQQMAQRPQPQAQPAPQNQTQTPPYQIERSEPQQSQAPAFAPVPPVVGVPTVGLPTGARDRSYLGL